MTSSSLTIIIIVILMIGRVDCLSKESGVVSVKFHAPTIALRFLTKELMSTGRVDPVD